MRLNIWKGKEKMNDIDVSFGTELLAKAEEIFSREFEEPVKFNGFVKINGELQVKFKFINENTTYLIFSASWKDLEKMVRDYKL
jgi:hypothetical protein